MDSTTWPDGVTARYLTAGGATVDVTAHNTTCTGCATAWPYGNAFAQSHAEKCRAIPRPAN